MHAHTCGQLLCLSVFESSQPSKVCLTFLFFQMKTDKKNRFNVSTAHGTILYCSKESKYNKLFTSLCTIRESHGVKNNTNESLKTMIALHILIVNMRHFYYSSIFPLPLSLCLYIFNRHVNASISF